MEVLEKARLALRNHLLTNKEKVLADLDAMRKKSVGNDIFNYIEKLMNFPTPPTISKENSQ